MVAPSIEAEKNIRRRFAQTGADQEKLAAILANARESSKIMMIRVAP